jgi:hypothetical protein
LLSAFVILLGVISRYVRSSIRQIWHLDIIILATGRIVKFIAGKKQTGQAKKAETLYNLNGLSRKNAACLRRKKE